MSRTRYHHIALFQDYKKDLIRRKATFEITSTTYSRKVRTPYSTIVFNRTGSEDYSGLGLINNARTDAKNFLKQRPDEIRDSYIHFYDMFEIPKEKDIICKVDVKGAYWNYALKRNIIQEKTNQSLIKQFEGKSVREMKDCRLRALGSLATTKKYQYWYKGVFIEELEDVQTEPTKPLYLEVCRGIDDLMQECRASVDGVYYYYWDCIFAHKDVNEKVIEFFKDNQYDVSYGETQLIYREVGEGGWLVSVADDKQYMVRKEQSYLLNNVQNINNENFGRDIIRL